MPAVRVDTTQLSAMIRELSARAAVPSDDVLVFEVGKILEKALSYTPAADVAKMRDRYENTAFSVQPRSLYTPQRITTSGSKVKYYLENRYPNALWAAISARRKASFLRRLRARGLAKRSWLDLAAQMGLEIRAPAFVRRAVATSGQVYNNTTARTTRSRGRLHVAIENAQPTLNLPKVGGARALQRAIDGRVSYFLRNLALGTFDDVAKVAKRYKGMRVTT